MSGAAKKSSGGHGGGHGGGAKHNHLLDMVLWTSLTAVFATAAAGAMSDSHYIFDFLTPFTGPMMAVALVGALLAMLVGRKSAMLAFLVAAGGLFIALRPQWFAMETPAGHVRPVSVYFANIWAQNDSIDKAARSVAEANADVVAMVEVSDLHERNADQLFRGYPHRIESSPAKNFEGAPRAVIVSRLPLKRVNSGMSDGLAVVEAEVMGPQPFRLVVVHLTRPWPFRGPHDQSRQIDRLVKRVEAGGTERTVVVGDFNATTGGARMRDFAQRAQMQPVSARMGDWPSPLPGPFRLAIENAFAGHDLMLAHRRIGPPNGSDHRPIVFDVYPARHGRGPDGAELQDASDSEDGKAPPQHRTAGWTLSKLRSLAH